MFKHIKEIRKERGLTQKQVSEVLGCSVRTYSSYENTDKVPIEVFTALAVYYDVSSDYLLGLTDIKDRFK